MPRRLTSKNASTSQSLTKTTISALDFPPEIITEIFTHIAATETLYIRLPPLGRRGKRLHLAVEPEYPWNISQVCSKWRQFALAIPSLWNDIIIVLDSDKVSEWLRVRELAMLCLSRTRQSLISIRVLVDPVCETIISSISGPIAGFVLAFADRLQHLALEPDMASELFLEVLPPGRLHVLESVELHCRYHSPTNGFRDAPNLRTVKLISNLFTGFYPPGFALPWAQLINLEVAFGLISYEECYAALRQCTILKRARLAIAAPLHYHFTIPDVSLPQLEFLEVYSAWPPADFGGFLRPFVLSGLKRLQLDSKRPLWSTADLYSLIGRSSCLLEHLEARGIEVSTLLTEIPSLSELSLHDALQYYGPNVDNESLISSILGDNLFPKLQKITCDIDVANCLIDVLGKRSKLAQVSPQLHTNIRTITIDRTSRGTSRTLKAGTRKLRALGIDVVFLDE